MDVSNDSIKAGCSITVEISSEDDDYTEIEDDEMIMAISSDEEDVNSILNREGLPNVSNTVENKLSEHYLCEKNEAVRTDTQIKKQNKIDLKINKKKIFPLFNNENISKPSTSKKQSDKNNEKSISKAKLNAIRNLFPSIKSENKVEERKETCLRTVCTRMVAGVKIQLPVKPYPSQMSLMDHFIKSIKKSKNCILESSTGSGKTLALLCAVLAWQDQERNVTAQEKERLQAELAKNISVVNISSPTSSMPAAPVTPDKLFTKQSFGDKSIYQTEVKVESPSPSYKRPGPYLDSYKDDESSSSALVNIHKKPRLPERDDDSMMCIPNQQVTPEKAIQAENKETPESLRKMYDEMVSLHFHRVPTIYYGARTHTQLQQVIKEFKRTAYCGVAQMTILSSRDRACIKEFDRKVWTSKEDMCRTCTKAKDKNETSCEFFDNRTKFINDLPDAFDLEDLVMLGKEKHACPYYGARFLAKNADIIFCPYNYLIDPSIRSSMQIDLNDSIIVIDEAHNIESICRDTASYSFTQKQVQFALKELEYVAGYRFRIQDIEHYLNFLIDSLKGWNDWFTNQIPLMINKAPYNKKVEHSWDAIYFVNTLQNHNIGYSRFESFKSYTEMFCRRLREDPRTLLGVTQSTAVLLESLSTVLGYLFRDEQKHIDDFKPALEATVNDAYKERSLENLTLHLHCLNSAIVMSYLHVARCIALASGTLSPMLSIHAELGTPFPVMISPTGNMTQDRVWIGVVKGDNKATQDYTYKELQLPSTRDRFGNLVERVCELTPHGVLCFVNSYATLDNIVKRWKFTGLWSNLRRIKHVFIEQRTTGEHEDMMKEFYEKVATKKGALLLAVYRGKVSEGMDFKDHQARAVICMGIPYPNINDIAVKAKIEYNERHKDRDLLGKNEWMQIQAYRALNQALGRCVRHKQDWGAVLLVDSRYSDKFYTEHLSKWVCEILNNRPYTYETLESREDGLATFMQRMKIVEEQKEAK